MALPAGVERVTVSSGVPLTLPNGRWLQGKIVFTGPVLVTIGEDDFAFGGGVAATLVDGQFSVDLVATDATGMSPTGWTYKVESAFTNAPNWTRYISLPKGTPSVKLADVLVPDPVAGEYSTLVDASTIAGLFLARGENLADLEDLAEARDNLELGEAATLDVGTVEGTVAAGDDPRFSASKPWVFDITADAYGAVGDAKIVTDGAVTGGVATLTCATSAPFHSGLVGKSVLIQGAGPAGVTAFATTFAAYNSPTSMALTATPPTTISGAIVAFGTNNYAAARAATVAAEAYLAAGHPYAEVYTPPVGGFVIDGPLDTSKSGNGQVPFGVYPTTGGKKTLNFRTDGSGAGVRHWQQLVPQISGGTWISFGFYSSTSAQTTDLNANGHPGIISGPNEGTANGLAYGASARFSNIQPMIENMAFLVPHTQFGITRGAANFFGCANAHVRNVSVSTLGVVPSATDYTSPGTFATGLSVAVLMPAPGNNDLSIIENLSIQGGFTYGLFFSEHTLIDRVMVLYCWAALCPVGNYAGSVGSVHEMMVLSASVEACAHDVYIIGVGSQGVGPTVDIHLSTESSTPNIDGNGAGALMAAIGRLKLTGLFTPSGVYTASPTGIEIINGQVPRPISRKTGAFTASPIDRTLICDTTSGAFTGTLPSADVNPVQYTLKNIGANNLTVGTTSSQLIYTTSGTGATTAVITTGQALTVRAMYNGVAWGWYAV